jgi:L-methionine (R)-S-oxide reductase
MQAEIESIIDRFAADTGTIHFVEDGVLVLKAHVGVPAQMVDVVRTVPIGKGMAGMAAERNEPVSSCNIQDDHTGTVPAGAKVSGVNGAIVVPIRDEAGKAVGALGIGVHREHQYSEDETLQLLDEGSKLARARPNSPPG